MNWMGPHQQMRALRYIGDLNELLADDRVERTGFSHPLAKLVSTGQLDLGCAQSDVANLISDHLLIDGAEPNVFLTLIAAGAAR